MKLNIVNSLPKRRMTAIFSLISFESTTQALKIQNETSSLRHDFNCIFKQMSGMLDLREIPRHIHHISLLDPTYHQIVPKSLQLWLLLVDHLRLEMSFMSMMRKVTRVSNWKVPSFWFSLSIWLPSLTWILCLCWMSIASNT